MEKNPMYRIERIRNHPLFIHHLKANEAAEADRLFCHHDMDHFLGVARIAQIINLEEFMQIPRVEIYAAALLHDMGKHTQYEEGTPHEQVSAQIAPLILKDCDFTPDEIQRITEAVLSHRDISVKEERSLRGLLYRGDKASRPCFSCKMEAECNWKTGKNLQILY